MSECNPYAPVGLCQPPTGQQCCDVQPAPLDYANQCHRFRPVVLSVAVPIEHNTVLPNYGEFGFSLENSTQFYPRVLEFGEFQPRIAAGQTQSKWQVAAPEELTARRIRVFGALFGEAGGRASQRTVAAFLMGLRGERLASVGDDGALKGISASLTVPAPHLRTRVCFDSLPVGLPESEGRILHVNITT